MVLEKSTHLNPAAWCLWASACPLPRCVAKPASPLRLDLEHLLTLVREGPCTVEALTLQPCISPLGCQRKDADPWALPRPTELGTPGLCLLTRLLAMLLNIV